ncbi:hypothetical protein ACFPM1_03640 [Halorubrum rubrum]|uniref:Uncharacterized protein n=1 Tax=Halorubrum rubrum TaxID=1126240 RepID=A0ABD5QZ32_9EURY|nr:hypothetical protein [Halorubrum rubrum]
MTVYENVKVHFDEGYASVYEEVKILSSGWVRCGTEPFGPMLFPAHRIEEVDAGYEG